MTLKQEPKLPDHFLDAYAPEGSIMNACVTIGGEDYIIGSLTDTRSLKAVLQYYLETTSAQRNR